MSALLLTCLQLATAPCTLHAVLAPLVTSAPESRAAENQPPETPLHNRDKTQRNAALKQFGGTRKTERAVADGLAWLAAHQRRDGVWDRRHFDRLCPQMDRCSQTAVEELDHDPDVAISAMAALAFLGAGHTHEQGPYREHLSNVFSYILAQQDAEGSFSSDPKYQNYCNAIATTAVAENYILTRDPVLKAPLQSAVDFLVRCQQADGGWDITAARSNRNDTSVTTWVLMALKSADGAGARIPLDTRFGILNHFDRATQPDGRVWYEDRQNKKDAAVLPLAKRRFGPGMTAAGLYARSALGLRLDDADAEKQVSLLLDALPNLDELDRPGTNSWYNEYYWYYGSLGVFNVGGAPWKKWNEALRRTILENQERPMTAKGIRRHAFGSWPAFGPNWGQWCRAGGRVYSTALNALTLETYYRYVPAYLSPQGLIGPAELRNHIVAMPASRHLAAVRLASRFHADTAEPALVGLLDSPDESARIAAACALAELGSPMGLPILTATRDGSAGRSDIVQAIERLTSHKAKRSYGGVLEVNPSARMFLFDTKGKPVYYGQSIAIVRDGRRIGVAKVVRRFSAYQSAAAKLEGSAVARVGDAIQSIPEGA